MSDALWAVQVALAALVHSSLGEAKVFRPLFAETHIGVMRWI